VKVYLPTLFPRENRPLIDEAKRVSEAIDGIKTPLTPGPGLDLGIDLGKSKLLSPREKNLDIFNRKIDVIWIGPGIKQIPIGTRIEAGEDHAIAIEIMSAGTHALAGLFENPGIKPHCGFDVGNGKNDAEKLHLNRPVGREIVCAKLPVFSDTFVRAASFITR